MAVYQNLTLTQVSQNREENTSRVRILWQSTQTGASYNAIEDVARYTVFVNGQARYTKEVAFVLPQNTTQTILDTEETVFHNDKGDGEITVTTWMNTRISAGIVELSQTLKLDNIPQASTVTATDGIIGGFSRLAVTRKNTQSTHAISWQFGALQGYLNAAGQTLSEEVRFAGESVDFYLPEDFYDEIPNAKSGICTLTVYTYSGDNPVGTPQTAQFTVSVEEGACIPEVFGTVTDTNAATLALTGDKNTLVAHRSNALCTVTATAKHGAHITEKRIRGQVVEETLFADYPESGDFLMEATDSRGFTGTYLVHAGLIPYRELTCTALAQRDGAVSGEATLFVSGTFFNGSFGAQSNLLALSYSVDGENFIPITAQLGEETYTAQVKLTGMDYARLYTITVRATDCLTAVEKKTVLKKGVPTFDWGEGDFAFHVPVQLDSDLSVGGSLTVGGKKLLDHIYPVGTVYTAAAVCDPSALFGGSWEQLESQQSIYRWKRTG